MLLGNDFRDIPLRSALGIGDQAWPLAPLRRGEPPPAAVAGLWWKTDGPTLRGSLRVHGDAGFFDTPPLDVLVPEPPGPGWTEERGVEFRHEGRVFHPVHRNGDRTVLHFDPAPCLRALLVAPFASARAPLYVRLRIPPHRLPTGLRRLLSTLRRKARARGVRLSYAGLEDFPRVELLRQRIAPAARYRSRSPVFIRHDVDTDWSLKNGFFRKILEVDEHLGHHACWNFVTRLYPIPWAVLDEIRERGHEFGFHDTRHDHRFAFIGKAGMERRYGESREFLERYKAFCVCLPAGMGSAEAYSWRHPDLPITSNYRHATYPFRLGRLLEVPYTHTDCYDRASVAPEEHLRRQEAMARWLAGHGSIINVATHPEPGLTGDERAVRDYRALLEEVRRLGGEPVRLSGLRREVPDVA